MDNILKDTANSIWDSLLKKNMNTDNEDINVYQPINELEIACVKSQLKESPDETKFDMYKIHKWNWSGPYTVLVGKIDLHNQT